MDFVVLADHRVKSNESEKRDKHLDLARELKKTKKKKYKTWRSRWHQMINKGNGRLRNKRTSEDHPDNSVIKINRDTEKSPADLKKLVITQIQGENPPTNDDAKNSHTNKLIVICSPMTVEIY